ncbi:MAG: tetratricopeptide repeat protein [Clostridiales bacterium]|nr:tetratricopeptide repeat protein [Clostridiales bacterium]
MKCVKCGRNVGADGFCTCCGFDNKHVAKACNTANYYYNLGLEKAQMRDLSGAISYLKKALTYNKSHKDARNLLGLVYYQMGERGRAYIQWKNSARLNNVEENQANRYIKEMEEHPAIFEEINETAKKYNQALIYARQGSDDLAMIQIKKVLSITPNFVNGHLLFALLHMRAGDNVQAKTDLNNALSIDVYNTTARRFLMELGEKPSADGPEIVPAENLRPDNENLKNVRPVDHYEDPSKDTWKQFVYMLIGLAIGVIAMFMLVIPSVRAGANSDYNKLKQEYEETVEAKDSEISQLQEDKESLQAKNKKLKKSLKVYEGSDDEDSMYDLLIKATQAYDEGDYVTCAEELSNIDGDSLPTEFSQNLYNTMKETAYSTAATQLYESAQTYYNAYNYTAALEDVKAAYTYSDEDDYEVMYLLAMCYKRTGDEETATPLFYDIINNSGDSDLIRKSANYGLEVVVATAQEQAAAYAGTDTDGTDENSTGEETDNAEGDEDTE